MLGGFTIASGRACVCFMSCWSRKLNGQRQEHNECEQLHLILVSFTKQNLNPSTLHLLAKHFSFQTNLSLSPANITSSSHILFPFILLRYMPVYNLRVIVLIIIFTVILFLSRPPLPERVEEKESIIICCSRMDHITKSRLFFV